MRDSHPAVRTRGSGSRWRAFALALACAALASGPVFGQAGTGSIRGRVIGDGGGALGGTSVTAKEVTTGVATSKLTGADGAYSIEALAPGPTR